MNERDRTLLRLIGEDCEAVPLPSLKTLTARLRGPKRHRLPDASALLLAAPGAAERTELYVWMLLNVTARQIGGRICLGPTFIRMVSEIEQEVREALPEWTRAGLEQLEQLAKGAPVPLPEDSRTLAHALAIDGALVRFLRVGRKASHYRVLGLDESADIGDVKAAYRRAAMRLHPDRNPAPEAAGKFIEIQRAYEELMA